MTEERDIRWQQRFSNYRKALNQLSEFLEQKELNKLEEQGLVKAFEYTYELAWNTLRDYLEYQGVAELIGSRDTFRKAFSEGLFSDGHVWMKMIESRNRTSHTCNEAAAREIVHDVRTEFHPAFLDLEQTLAGKTSE
ncbi:nucleotidyltransferase substrate binding protein [Kiritimatiella glycovorans]|uniref:Nucleotidyltransferase substrate binding protein, family n=1 Tax=Kiritimatiella glycovorans TaxID=1307763 RepID=A0A0G3EN19_9BACT|nr:nucleotidyltransferase substrate binding protein [Kiritimatiella glycovorans]AKJ65539.1 nucleotidyltransferase substrate binding protein, family [Kiritimatiella glycovorans]